jgi:hypothetical protein
MRKLSKKQTALVAGVTLAALGTSGVAYAYWSTSGNGTGTASTTAGTASLTLTQLSAPTNLAPGVAAGAVSVRVENDAVNNAYVAKVIVSISSVTDAADAAIVGCDATDYALTATGAGATQVGATVQMTDGAGDLAKSDGTAGSGADQKTFAGASLGFVNKPLTLQDACKNAVVHLGYAAT